jgi:hypothetical protein
MNMGIAIVCILVHAKFCHARANFAMRLLTDNFQEKNLNLDEDIDTLNGHHKKSKSVKSVKIKYAFFY